MRINILANKSSCMISSHLAVHKPDKVLRIKIRYKITIRALLVWQQRYKCCYQSVCLCNEFNRPKISTNEIECYFCPAGRPPN